MYSYAFSIVTELYDHHYSNFRELSLPQKETLYASPITLYFPDPLQP